MQSPLVPCNRHHLITDVFYLQNKLDGYRKCSMSILCARSTAYVRNISSYLVWILCVVFLHILVPYVR